MTIHQYNAIHKNMQALIDGVQFAPGKAPGGKQIKLPDNPTFLSRDMFVRREGAETEGVVHNPNMKPIEDEHIIAGVFHSLEDSRAYNQGTMSQRASLLQRIAKTAQSNLANLRDQLRRWNDGEDVENGQFLAKKVRAAEIELWTLTNSESKFNQGFRSGIENEMLIGGYMVAVGGANSLYEVTLNMQKGAKPLLNATYDLYSFNDYMNQVRKVFTPYDRRVFGRSPLDCYA